MLTDARIKGVYDVLHLYADQTNHNFHFNCKNKWIARDSECTCVYFHSFILSIFSFRWFLCFFFWNVYVSARCYGRQFEFGFVSKTRNRDDMRIISATVMFILSKSIVCSLLRFISCISMIIDGNHIIFIRNQLNYSATHVTLTFAHAVNKMSCWQVHKKSEP